MTILKYKDSNGDWQTFSNTTIGNADTLDGHTASETPTAGQIPVVDSSGDLNISGDIYSNGEKVAIELDYSTSEQDTGLKWIDGRTIYRKTVNFGALPNNATKGVAHGIVNLDFAVSIYGSANNGSTHFPLPYVSTDTFPVTLAVAGTDVQAITYRDRTSYVNCYITIEYVKTS